MGVLESFRIWLLFIMTATSKSTPLRGLPFNLPESKFCTTCELDVTKFYYPSVPMDEACLGYLIDIQSPYATVDGSMHKLLEDLENINSPASFVVHAYLQSMRAYQWVYKEPYDISLLCIPTIEDSSCIKIIKSGQGFSRPITLSGFLKNETMSVYTKGRHWENIFLRGIEDIWVSSVCNTGHHERSAISALQRVLQTWESSKEWKIHKHLQRNDVVDPKVNINLFRPCGDNSSIPPTVSDSIAKCKGQMECQLNPPSQGNTQPQEASKKQSADQSTNQHHDVGMRQPAAKKSRLEEQQQKFIINEFNPFKTTHGTQEEFLEIRVHPSPGNKKQTFKSVKIICIGAVTQKLLMVANLLKVDIPQNGYFFIRSTSLSGKNYVHLSNDDHQFKLLPGYAKEPIAIVLLEMTNRRTQLSAWEKLKLRPQRDGSKFSRDLTGDTAVWDVIRETIIDAQLYGTIRNQQIASHVQSILPYSGCNFVIPIGDVDSELEMTSSINYCKANYQVQPFQFNFFKLGAFTIGFPNDCNRDVDYQVQRTEHIQRNDVDTVGVTSTPSSDTECPRVNNLVGLLQTQIMAEVDLIRHKCQSQYTTNLYPTDTFKKTVWKEIYEQEVLNLDEIRELHPFELVPHDGEHGRSTHFRCKVCHQRLHECPDSLGHKQKKSKTADGEVIPTSFSVLKRKMFDHLDSQQHLTSVLYFIQNERIKLTADEGKKLMVQADPQIQQLANVMDITFTFLHTNTAPYNSKAWYETLTKIHANVGGSLHSKDTAYRIVDFIASEGTANIFRYLVYKDSPFTLILDGSADNRNHHYVIVYMQTLEGEMTIPYFAFFLKLGTSFTADSYLSALKEKVVEIEKQVPGFHDYFMRRIIAVATDSAKVMELFHSKLNGWIARKGWNGEGVDIVSIYCLAHKLQLSSRNSIVPLKTDVDVSTDSPLYYFQYVEKFMQSSYVWFKWSGKRIGLFRQLIVEEGLPKVEFKELHAERWISSEYSTVKNFVTAWKTARMALERMLNDNPKDTKIREEIKSYDDQFRDKTALITVHFLWDFTAAFKVWSEFLQKMSGLLIDQFKYFEQLRDNLVKMEQFDSPVLSEFLSNCECGPKIGCTLKEYEDADQVRCYGLLFGNTNPDSPTFSISATSLLRKVQEQLIKYIPWELLANVYSLHPSQLPASKEVLNMQYPPSSSSENPFARVYAGEEVAKLAQMLGIEPSGFLNEWQKLIESILALDSWKDLRVNHDTNVFWTLALRKSNIYWTERTRYFIRALKTISPGSVACETGFSIFNNIKTKNRIGTLDSHVESIMKILINGPKTVNEFDSNLYATYWLIRGHTKPKPEVPLQEKLCESVPEEAFEILDDTERDQERSLTLFPFEIEALPFQDVYARMSKLPEFRESTKEKRTKERPRSKIF